MAVDTFIAYIGVYPSVEDAESDYQLVKDLHTKANMLDAYDAAVIEKRDNGKVRITKKHETPTRVGGVLGGGVGLATGLVVALFPFAAIGGGLLAATAAGGAVLGSVAGHAAAGMSRHDLKELGEYLDEGQAGLVVVGVVEMEDDIKQSMSKAEKVETQGDQGRYRGDRTGRQSCWRRASRRGCRHRRLTGLSRLHPIWVMTSAISSGDGAIVATSKAVRLCRTMLT